MVEGRRKVLKLIKLGSFGPSFSEVTIYGRYFFRVREGGGSGG